MGQDHHHIARQPISVEMVDQLFSNALQQVLAYSFIKVVQHLWHYYAISNNKSHVGKVGVGLIGLNWTDHLQENLW